MRKCHGPDKTNICRGVAARHHVCDNKPCEKGGLSRGSQCAEFDTEGVHWVASYSSSEENSDKCTLDCELKTMKREQRGGTVTKTMAMVRDGTDCMPRDRHTVCVWGQCQVG